MMLSFGNFFRTDFISGVGLHYSCGCTTIVDERTGECVAGDACHLHSLDGYAMRRLVWRNP